MTTVTIDGYAQCAAYFQCATSARELVITCGFRNSTLLMPNAINSYWRGALLGSTKLFGPAQMSDTYRCSKTYTIANIGGILYSDVATIAVIGTNAMEVPPVNVSVIAQKYTARAGRSYRGRMALPPCILDEADVDSAGRIETSALNTINANLTTLYLDMVAHDLPPYLLHGATLPGGLIPGPTEILNFEASNLVGTSRHRLKRS